MLGGGAEQAAQHHHEQRDEDQHRVQLVRHEEAARQHHVEESTEVGLMLAEAEEVERAVDFERRQAAERHGHCGAGHAARLDERDEQAPQRRARLVAERYDHVRREQAQPEEHQHDRQHGVGRKAISVEELEHRC